MYNFKQREAEIDALYSKILARDNEPKPTSTSTQSVEDLAKSMGINNYDFGSNTEQENQNLKSIFEKAKNKIKK
jgi:hypothetical protein